MDRPPEKPLPIPAPESTPFWEAAQRRELALPFCRRCDQFFTPPAARCPLCLEDDLQWRGVSGRGQVFSYTTYHRAYHPAYRDSLPYVVALVQLEEGPRLVSNIVGCSPHDVHCDMPVEVTYEQRGRAVIPQFAPAR